MVRYGSEYPCEEVDDSAWGADITEVLEGILVIGPCVMVTFQGPKGNATEELWLVTNGLTVMFGGMEVEVLNPGGGT